MRIATVSLNYYGQNSVEDCVIAGRRIARRKIDIAGLTEVRSEKMRDGLELGAGEDFELVGRGYESPQLFNNKKWRQTGFRIVKGTDGEEGITPDLFCVVAYYEKWGNPSKKIAVISTHLVPLTLKGRKRPDFDKRYNQMWKPHWRRIKTIVNECVKDGRSVFVIADFNNKFARRRKIKEIHPKAKWIVKRPLDWIFFIPANTKIRKFGPTIRFSSGSDHMAYLRVVWLR